VALIEITTFRLADGVGDDAFLEVDERVRTGFLYHQPGLLRATTARNGDEWVTVVLWQSEADADAAATDLMALINPATLERRRYTTFD
jgi:hypothetical protein